MFKGSIVALITPFKNNEVDFDSLDKILDMHLKNKTDGIVVLGTTSEESTLTDLEKVKLIKYIVFKCKGKIKIIAGVIENDTNKAIAISQKYESLNCDGLLVVTPFYNKANDYGIYLHFSEIARNVSIPIIIYNVPSRTGVDISSSSVCSLKKISNIIGIKEASTNIKHILSMYLLADESFYLYCGNDELIPMFKKIDCMGYISVLANAFPNLISDLYYNYSKEKYEKNSELFELLELDINPIIIKEIMNYYKYIELEYRLPLCETKKSNKEIIKKVLNNYIDKNSENWLM